ncbi:DNA cytosine methyltransferase [Shewanella sp. HL-SH8]|uniref:DNA cytosine methyltransferase n=1 Tax=Shewanella sp. HL-SH8 TaxID=3436242 RepID=UPI003EBD52E9
MKSAHKYTEINNIELVNNGAEIIPLKPKVISLFTGCGGLDFGFHKAGYEIVYANDIEPSVKATYEANLGPIDIKDICEVDKKSLPDCDVILAGIPCQPFSSAGNRKSTQDDRGNLFLQVMELVDLKQPKVVLFENVRGFLSARDDNGTLMPERIRSELDNHGYNLFYKLLNASNYEVPQNRHRVVLVGIRKDLDIAFEFPEPITQTNLVRVDSVINKPLPEDEDQEVWKLSPQSERIAKYIPEGGSWKAIPYDELPLRLKKIRDDMKKYRSPNFYRKFSRNEIMGTITAASTPENSGILHPIEDRRYSVREIARFQSFPDTFKFIGNSIPKKYKMIGNAVPCLLSYHIAKSIKKQIFNHIE